MPAPFPPIHRTKEDQNPAIQLFGRRFFSDQTTLELLSEFLLVLHAAKMIGRGTAETSFLLPTLDQLKNWPANSALFYRPKMRLNLKLFAFLGSSKLETRHVSHRHHYQQLLQRMKEKMATANSVSKDEVLRGLENLFQGFQGAGLSRTWCAQTFLPASVGLLSGETIWKSTKATRAEVSSWDEAMEFFDFNQRLFLARGGELLYLHICNALRQRDDTIKSWIQSNEFPFAKHEISPLRLHEFLTHALPKVTGQCPPGIQELSDWIDRLYPETLEKTDEGEPTPCGWCPEESWPEGYLFAVELSRICQAEIDPIERIELLTIGCALQVLRTLCAQSARYDDTLDLDRKAHGGSLGFSWICAGPSDGDRAVWKLSERNLMFVQNMIYSALRDESIRAAVPGTDVEKQKLYQEADRRYGHKLFLSLAKKIGLIVPQRGPGARFTLNDKIMRYFVLALVRPGEKCTLDSFKAMLYSHYGLAVAGDQLRRACRWSGLPPLEDSFNHSATWFEEMLRASNFMVRLSDACSLVQNPFSSTQNLENKLKGAANS